MRLTSIKLAGFKSFVDPTTFRAPSNLTGIVGPNGCGKSNIIDAVRWVMGEGSARVLRGELMSDVIFTGSSTRKPVGTATVELLFDNSDGRAAGEFADFNEISVKRQVSRDGISVYFLNGTRCRRKDVRDLFLGTGLGSSGYSIIEQGMISQIVDARPEQIRGHLEEAAGISRYKERRRETENRIRNTRDNLDRLADLREEVDNHLSRLKRQARAAERYSKLKQERRELESRLLALHWHREINKAVASKKVLAEHETAMAAKVAEQRAAEANMETLRQGQAEASEALAGVQGELYEVAADIARLEQAIQHNRELQAQQEKEFEETSTALKDLEQHMLLDRAQVDELTTRLADREPALEAAVKAEADADAELGAAETEVSAWQERLEAHHTEFNELNRTADGLRASLEVSEQRLSAATGRLAALEGETESVGTGELDKDVARLEQKHREAISAEAEQQAKLDQLNESLAEAREELRQDTEREHGLQSDYLAAEGRLAALQTLQQASQESEQGEAWLQERGLAERPLLASSLKVDTGWETAVETVLGHWLDARVIDGMEDNAGSLDAVEGAELALVHESSGKVRARTGTLAEKVRAPDAITALLNHVRAVDSLDEALEFLERVGEEESAVTHKGEWIGPGWARVARGAGARAGMLAREREIESLDSNIAHLREQWHSQRDANEKARDELPRREAEIVELQVTVNDQHRASALLESRLSGVRSRIEDLGRRGEQIGVESGQLRDQQTTDRETIKEARGKLETVLGKMAEADLVRSELDAQRKALLERRDAARPAAAAARNSRHELALDTSSCRASLDSLVQSLERMDSQVSTMQQRYLTLSEANAKAVDPAEDCRVEMDGLLQNRVEVETRLGEARARQQQLEHDYREKDALRQQAVQQAEGLRADLERAKLSLQEVQLNARNLERQAEAMGANVEELAEHLPDDAEVERWEADIERLGVRITRLEPVNLAAIQEYEEELKRKEYLDAQHNDLTEALETLESAIAKIDRRTRTRFKDTFEKVNKGMQELFPRLFGGGHGYLEMTGEDLLTTGVSIMARPPGKRVSSIHLLSGGEKALTAVSFVFAIFHLNPAPFCLLDEVDAPLDDSNVGRFSELVKEMSDSVQFIIVTHNKITMEMVYQLSGVTMREPGVSRLVQVDIDEAARLAAS
jgi:chromosome segregation protein